MNPLVIPRVGEMVKFADGFGFVASVRWKPIKAGDLEIQVVCEPE